MDITTESLHKLKTMNNVRDIKKWHLEVWESCTENYRGFTAIANRRRTCSTLTEKTFTEKTFTRGKKLWIHVFTNIFCHTVPWSLHLKSIGLWHGLRYVYFLSVKQSELERKLALIVCICTHAWCCMVSAHASGLRVLGCLVCMHGRWWSKAIHSRQFCC